MSTIIETRYKLGQELKVPHELPLEGKVKEWDTVRIIGVEIHCDNTHGIEKCFPKGTILYKVHVNGSPYQAGYMTETDLIRYQTQHTTETTLALCEEKRVKRCVCEYPSTCIGYCKCMCKNCCVLQA